MCNSLAGENFLKLFQKGCMKKKYYANKKAARWAILEQWRAKRLGGSANIYDCKYCNGFHITSNKNARI